MLTFTAQQLTSLLNDARLFDAELSRVRACEVADAETDPQRRTSGSFWRG